jgi:hypothetical protein
LQPEASLADPAAGPGPFLHPTPSPASREEITPLDDQTVRGHPTSPHLCGGAEALALAHDAQYRARRRPEPSWPPISAIPACRTAFGPAATRSRLPVVVTGSMKDCELIALRRPNEEAGRRSGPARVDRQALRCCDDLLGGHDARAHPVVCWLTEEARCLDGKASWGTNSDPGSGREPGIRQRQPPSIPSGPHSAAPAGGRRPLLGRTASHTPETATP